jgi:hypothetical protein
LLLDAVERASAARCSPASRSLAAVAIRSMTSAFEALARSRMRLRMIWSKSSESGKAFGFVIG